jgi:thiamine-phosphate diphosphorylase
MAVVEDAEAGLRAATRGATIIQLRAPHRTARDVERDAMRLKADSPVRVIVSSRCDIALAAGLAGVNLPESDISVADAKQVLRAHLISRSVHSLEAARQAEEEGADFVIFGPVWESATHPGGKPQGVEALRRVAEGVSIPVIAIGGVSEVRVPEVLSICGGYAAISLFR